MPTKNGYRLEWKKRKRYRWKRLLHTNTHLYYQFLSHRLSFFKVDFSIRKQTRKKSWFMMKRNSTKKKIWNACLNTLETNCVCMYYIDSFDQNENIGKKLVHQIPHHRWIFVVVVLHFLFQQYDRFVSEKKHSTFDDDDDDDGDDDVDKHF